MPNFAATISQFSAFAPSRLNFSNSRCVHASRDHCGHNSAIHFNRHSFGVRVVFNCNNAQSSQVYPQGGMSKGRAWSCGWAMGCATTHIDRRDLHPIDLLVVPASEDLLVFEIPAIGIHLHCASFASTRVSPRFCIRVVNVNRNL